MSFTDAHTHRHSLLLQQDDTDEVQLIVSDFSQDSLPKTHTQALPQVTVKVPEQKKLSNEDLVHTEDLDYDMVDKNTYKSDELEAFTDSTVSGKKSHDLFYYGMRPDSKPVAKPKAEHHIEVNVSANATKTEKAAATAKAVKLHQDERQKAKQARRAQAVKDSQDEDEYDTHIDFGSIDNTPF